MTATRVPLSNRIAALRLPGTSWRTRLFILRSTHNIRGLTETGKKLWLLADRKLGAAGDTLIMVACFTVSIGITVFRRIWAGGNPNVLTGFTVLLVVSVWVLARSWTTWRFHKFVRDQVATQHTKENS